MCHQGSTENVWRAFLRLEVGVIRLAAIMQNVAVLADPSAVFGDYSERVGYGGIAPDDF